MDLYLRYIRDKGAVVHIWDYVKDRADRALCGHGYVEPVDLDERRTPARLCRSCRDLMPVAEAVRYRQAAEEYAEYADQVAADYNALGNEYEFLWSAYEDLLRDYEICIQHSEHQRKELARLQGGRPSNRRLSPRVQTPSSPNKKKKKSKNESGLRINPGNRPPSGRPRVKLWSGR